jgi:hypothetical protein
MCVIQNGFPVGLFDHISFNGVFSRMEGDRLLQLR